MSNKSRPIIFINLSVFLLIFSLYSLKAQVITGPEQDCDNALAVCKNIYVQNQSYQGNGNVSEVNGNTSCLDNGETNSVWYIFTVTGSGQLEFTLYPQPSGDYDFTLYDITNGSCADITAGTAPEVRCNYAFSTGPTGLQAGFTATSEGPGGQPFLAPLAVNVNQTFALVVDNFGLNQLGYILDFSASTASIFDFLPPQIANNLSNQLTCQNTDSLIITFTEPVLCDSINLNGGNFAISGPSAVSIDSVIIPDCQTGSFTLSAILYFSSPITVGGNYYIKMVADASGTKIADNCENLADDSDSVRFRVPEIVEAEFSYLSASGCDTDTVNFTNESTGNYTTSTWSFGDGTTSSVENPQHVYANVDTYLVSLNVASSGVAGSPGCNNTYTDTVIVSTSFSIDFTFMRQQPCVNEVVQFTDISTSSANNFFWDFGDGNISSDQNPTHRYTQPGNFIVEFVKFQAVGDSCRDTIKKPIFIRENVDADFTYDPQTSCIGDPITFTDISSGSPTGLLWEFEDGFTSTDSMFTHVFDSVGTDSIKLTVRDSLCLNRISDTKISITTETAPIFDLGPDQSICLGETVMLNAASNANNFLWSTGEMAEMIEFGDIPGEVWAIAYLGNCDYSDTVFIDEKLDGCAAAIVPTAFSPNNDNINDVLKIVTLRVADVELMIFNRWGEKMFETDDPNIGWDGTYKDEPQGIGTYTYILRWRAATSDTRLLTESGTITLIR